MKTRHRKSLWEDGIIVSRLSVITSTSSALITVTPDLSQKRCMGFTSCLAFGSLDDIHVRVDLTSPGAETTV